MIQDSQAVINVSDLSIYCQNCTPLFMTIGEQHPLLKKILFQKNLYRPVTILNNLKKIVDTDLLIQVANQKHSSHIQAWSG